MTRQRLLILLTICSPLIIAWCIYDFAGMVRRRDTRDIVTDFAAAQKTMEQSPPGIERADEFVRHLKAINTGHAPAEVKQALAAYADAFEQGIAAAKAHQDTALFNRTIAERRESLLAAVRKFQ